jgi:hypothetical protein
MHGRAGIGRLFGTCATSMGVQSCRCMGALPAAKRVCTCSGRPGGCRPLPVHAGLLWRVAGWCLRVARLLRRVARLLRRVAAGWQRGQVALRRGLHARRGIHPGCWRVRVRRCAVDRLLRRRVRVRRRRRRAHRDHLHACEGRGPVRRSGHRRNPWTRTADVQVHASAARKQAGVAGSTSVMHCASRRVKRLGHPGVATDGPASCNTRACTQYAQSWLAPTRRCCFPP